MTATVAGRAPSLALVATDAYSLNTLTRGQLEYFKERGIRLSLYCGGSHDEVQRLKERDVGEVHRVPFKRPPNPFWDLLALLWMCGLFLRRRHDAVVCSTPKAMLIGSMAAFLTRQRRRTVLVRGRAYERATGLKRSVYLGLDRLAFASAHQILFVSRSLMAAYTAEGADFAGSARVLGHGSSNGIDLGRFRPASPEERARLRASLDVPQDAFVILTAGRVTADKGINEVLETARLLAHRAEVLWILVGPIEDPHLAAKLAPMRHLRVRHVPFTAAIEDWFRSADLHLSLSHREGFGNVGAEAAACNVPTFAFDIVGVKDSVADGITGRLFRFGDLGSLAAAIEAAVEDRTGFSTAYSGARVWVAERFAQEAVWQLYLEAFMGDAGSATTREAE